MRALAMVTMVVLVLGVQLGCGGESEVDNSALRERMGYLENLTEVDWVDFQGGSVFIGFNQRTGEIPNIVNTAVALAHKAHGKGVHIYAVDGAQPGWRPGDGPIVCEASMKMGVLEQACM